jgi:prepilin-type N-terminal cleavage/methylation domain-containing protein
MRRQARGFTLIEVMIVAMTIGVLASVAFPLMQGGLYRARRAERESMLRAINAAMNDYWARNGRFPTADGAGSVITLPPNPGLPPKGYKRSMIPNLGDWGLLSVNTEGGVYITYSCQGDAGTAFAGGAGQRRHICIADQDLDHDGIAPFRTDTWLYTNETLTSHSVNDAALTDPVLAGAF